MVYVERLRNMKNKTLKFITIFMLSGLAFFALTLPFHRILAVFTLSEVRPSAVLYPFLGISFGLPSALGIAVANLISDYMNGYSAAVLIEGFIPQLLYSYIPYLIWKKLTKGEDHAHRLDSVDRVMKFVSVCFVSAFLSGVLTSLIIMVNFHTSFLQVAFFVFLNNFDVSIILGCPLMIISNQIISRKSGSERIITPNEKIILLAGLVEIIGLTILISTMYSSNTLVGTYDIWNSIYIYSVILVNAILLVALIAMIVNENKRPKVQ